MSFQDAYKQSQQQLSTAQEALSNSQGQFNQAKKSLSNTQGQFNAAQKSYNTSKSRLNSSKSARSKSSAARTKAQRLLNTHVKGFNMKKEQRQVRNAKRGLSGYKAKNRNQFNRNKKRGIGQSKRYKNYNQYRRAQQRARRRYNNERNDIRGFNTRRSQLSKHVKTTTSRYNAANNNFLSAQKQFNSAGTSFKSAQQALEKSQSHLNKRNAALKESQSLFDTRSASHNKTYGAFEKNLNQQKSHQHSTWQDSFNNGEGKYNAFMHDTSNTSYGVSGTNYSGKKQSFADDKSRVNAVKNATKNYGGVLPYGGKPEDYNITENGLLIPKGTNYSYADKDMIGQDGYKSEAGQWNQSVSYKSGGIWRTSKRGGTQVTRAKKFNEESEAMKNFRSVHSQDTYNNMLAKNYDDKGYGTLHKQTSSYNTSTRRGSSTMNYTNGENNFTNDFSAIARYQNAFYNRGVSKGAAKTQVAKRTDATAASRLGDQHYDSSDDRRKYDYQSRQYYELSETDKLKFWNNDNLGADSTTAYDTGAERQAAEERARQAVRGF